MKKFDNLRIYVEDYIKSHHLFTFDEIKEDIPDEYSPKDLKRLLTLFIDENKLMKPFKDVYCHPVNTRFGTLYPSIEDIVRKIAGLLNENIATDGYHALNELGLSTQVPMKYTYITNGKTRNISVHGINVHLKHVPAWCFYIDKPIMRLLTQAIRVEGQKNISQFMKNKNAAESTQFNSKVNDILDKAGFTFGMYEVEMVAWEIPGWIRKYLDFIYYGKNNKKS